MNQIRKATDISRLLFLILLFVQVATAQWVSTGPTRGGYVFDMCALGSYVFLSDYENGIFRSTDNGASWETVNSGLTNKFIRAFAVKGTSIFAGGEEWYDNEYGEFFFISSDSGKTWKNISSQFPALQYWPLIHSIEVCGNNIYMVTNNGNGVLRSTDNGTTWTPGDSGLVYPFDTVVYNGNRFAITEVAVGGDTVFAASGNKLFISYDSASSWTALASWGFDSGYVTSLALTVSNLFVGTHKGYYKSTNQGANWSAGNFNVANLFISKLAGKGDTIFAVDEPEGGFGPPQLYRSIDNGKSWSSIKKFNCWATTLFISEHDVFTGCADTLYRSSDNGVSWSTIWAGKQISCIAARGSIVLIQTTTEGIFRSTDHGNTWAAYENFPDTTIFSFAVSGKHIYAGTADKIFHSSDDGLSWAAMSTGSTDIGTRLLSVKGNIMVTEADRSASSVIISTDTGRSWTKVTIPLDPEIRSISITGDTIFAGTYFGVSRIINTGTGWSVTTAPVSTGELNHCVYSLTVNETDVFAGTTNGSVWRCPLADFSLSTKKPAHHAASSTILKINSPCTIGTTARISFSLSDCRQVAIRIYNVSGAVVQSFPGKYFESGLHTLTWDTRFRSPGCYWIKMQAGNNVYGKRVTLVR
jgi:photosystem II stability/assembly factor-like uncharacterized protein